MDYKEYAMNEFRIAGWTEDGKFKTKLQENICNDVLDMLELISKQNHTPEALHYALTMVMSLARHEPITELTGEEDEWDCVSVGKYKNKRCPKVFKDVSKFFGQPYDAHGIIFWEWVTDEVTGDLNKRIFVTEESATPIVFPYIPKSEYKEKSKV